jgi:hypothetical protein
MLSGVRKSVGDWLYMRAIHRHGGRVGWRIAGRYSRYLNAARRARRESGVATPDADAAVRAFAANRVTSLWTPETERLAQAMASQLDRREAAGESVWLERPAGDSNASYAGRLWQDFPEVEAVFRSTLGPFLEAHFGSWFKVYYGMLYRSDHNPVGPRGSALWHSDSGPGSCINVMFYLDETSAADGPLQVLPWDASISVFARERAEMRRRFAGVDTSEMDAMERRAVRCNWYEEVIAREFAERVVQPVGRAGLIVPFANNTIHRGGFPDPGHRRRAVVFHCYPSDCPTDWSRYARQGIDKHASYPKDPAERF